MIDEATSPQPICVLAVTKCLITKHLLAHIMLTFTQNATDACF